MKHILFEDDFEGDALKPVWRMRGSQTVPNAVGSVTSRRSVFLEDGKLHLLSVPTQTGFAHASIGTGEVHGPFDFVMTKGYVEAKVKFNRFHGAHGAVWLMPATDYEVGQAEIDFAEYNGVHNPNRKSGTTLHQNVYHRTAEQGENQFTQIKFDAESHDWGVRWDDWNRFKVKIARDHFTFYINGKISGEVETDGEFPEMPKFLCISMLTKYEIEAEAMTHNHELPEMEVDWIRAWEFVS